MSKYLGDLIRIARDEMPSLQYDLQNASTTFSLQAASQKIFNILGYVLHHAIHEAAAKVTAPSSPAPAPAPVIIQPSQVVPAVHIVPRSMPAPQHAAKSVLTDLVASLPPPGGVAQPQVTVPSIPNTPDMPIQAGVTNVFVTSQGTQAIAPDGTKTVLPPGAPVDLAATAGGPPELPYAPPGTAQVVLPPGGGMTPELAAALAGSATAEPTT